MAKKKNMVVDGTEQLEVLMGVKVPENVTNDDLPVDDGADFEEETPLKKDMVVDSKEMAKKIATGKDHATVASYKAPIGSILSKAEKEKMVIPQKGKKADVEFNVPYSRYIRTAINGVALRIYYEPQSKDVNNLIKRGGVPIDLSYGPETVVNAYQIASSNTFCYQKASCLQAINYYGILKDNDHQNSILVNKISADTILSALILLGALPKSLCEKIVPTVAAYEVDRFNPNVRTMDYYPQLHAWVNAIGLSNGSTNINGIGGAYCWLFGAQMFASIFSDETSWKGMLDYYSLNETSRIATAEEDMKNGIVMSSGKVIMIPKSRIYGHDIFFGRDEESSVTQLSGWKNWVCIVLTEKTKKISIGCPNDNIAEALFGKGGLQNVYKMLPKMKGTDRFGNKVDMSWGGKVSIGGSPKECEATYEDLENAATILDGLVKKAIGMK